MLRSIIGAEIAMILLALLSYYLISAVAGFTALFVGYGAIMYYYHTKYTYKKMQNDPDFTGNALISAAIVVFIQFALAAIGATIVFFALLYISTYINVPLIVLLVGAAALGFAFIVFFNG